MIEVKKILRHPEADCLTAIIVLPGESAECEYVFYPSINDDAPIHQELCRRYEAGEFAGITEDMPAGDDDGGGE